MRQTDVPQGFHPREPNLTNPFLKKIAGTIEEHGLFLPGQKVVVAVSGGADSVVLLDVLARLENLGLSLVVAHLNHNLRGAESDADAAFVAELAARYALPAESGSEDVRALSRQSGLSLEDAGRTARYRWLDAVASKHCADRIALGHHGDDQAETFLLRLLRGAGTTGLAGMRPLAAGRYARPLLYADRSEIVAYAEARGLSFRNDSSNGHTVFLRNRIRHELLPLLRTYNPAVSGLLRTAAEVLAADGDVLDSMVGSVYHECARRGPGEVVLSLAGLSGQLPGVRYRLYRRALLESCGSLAGISRVHLDQVEALAGSGRVNGRLSLPGGSRVVRCYGDLAFRPPGVAADPAGWEMTVAGPGTFVLPDGSVLSLDKAPPPGDWRSVTGWRAYLDPGSAPFPLLVRTFRPGDRIRPLGMAGTRKVKDLFIDAKLPLPVRRRLPLVFAGETLLWVPGLRVSEEGRVRPGAVEVLRVEIRGMNL